MSLVTATLNAPLPKPLRTQLENTIKAARDVAEKAGKAALAQLAVNEAKAPDYLSAEQKALRRSLRAHGRALGDVKHIDDTQGLQHLIWEVSYEHWHRMLFARFLAESGLLMWEPGAAVSLDDCRDMVDNHPDMAMGAKSHWELAGKLAARMLPQVFKPQSPVFELSFAPEDQRALEKLLANLPAEVFQASDSLGWVYQFWQAKRKDEVNASEVKIGADELPAVTQLFTEPYMVDFLLHNSLGAWWMTRHPDTPCPVPMPYLRTLEDGTPAAGNFEGWPDTLKDFKLLDPSCGSGHFLVAAFLLLVPLRMADEGLTALDAVNLVVKDNLHGLEIDPRCVEIAVFALALAAWRYPDEDGNPLGVRADMPAPRIACCGLKVAASSDDWQALVPSTHLHAPALRAGLVQLHNTFAQAPLLGSLLDPRRTHRADMFAADYDALQILLTEALAQESTSPTNLTTVTDDVLDGDAWHTALAAQGLLEAARLLDMRYDLIVTNVPFQTAISLTQALKDHISNFFSAGKANLATAMALRLMALTTKYGCIGYVSPQTWMALKGYEEFRRHLLKLGVLRLVARLGDKAFQSPGSNGEQISLTLVCSQSNDSNKFFAIDASMAAGADEKAVALHESRLLALDSSVQLKNPQAIVLLEAQEISSSVGEFATALCGVSTSDSPRFIKKVWEVSTRFDSGEWELHHSTTGSTNMFAGMDNAIFWQNETGELARLAETVKHLNHNVQNWRRGKPNWHRKGIVVSQMGTLEASLYLGNIYDNNCTALVPEDQSLVSALWAYVVDGALGESVRRLNQKRSVEVGTFLAAEFDSGYWTTIAAERFPHVLNSTQN